VVFEEGGTIVGGVVQPELEFGDGLGRDWSGGDGE
jgi:hypothetical protein